MNESERGQVPANAAQVYEEFFLPALFQEWPDRVIAAARLQPGQRVLDVACGTGVLTVAAADRVGSKGSVVGLDINPGMLAVARRKSAHIDWRHAPAEQMPFPDQSFDAVISQFGLMFFEDRGKAVSEMARVLKPNGRLAVAVWDSLENTPGYAAMTNLLQRLFDDEVANALRAPYVLGDPQAFRSLFIDAGFADVTLITIAGTARFPSLKSWMYTDIKGWTLANDLNDVQFDRLQREAELALVDFVREDGSVRFAAPAHILAARKMASS